MHERRWLRIIPVALIMYTISYVDRTNISLALDRRISSMMSDLADGRQNERTRRGHLFLWLRFCCKFREDIGATRWGARKIVSIFSGGVGPLRESAAAFVA